MGNNKRQKAMFWGLVTSSAIIGLILLSMKFMLGTPLGIRALAVFGGYGILVGIATAALIYFRWKVAGVVFSTGLFVGIFEMIRGFSARSNGWGDLIGVLSIMLWPAAALALGLLLQSLYWIYRRYQERNIR